MGIKGFIKTKIIWPIIMSAAKEKLKMLSGWKTYIAAALGIIAGGIYAMGWIDLQTFTAIEGIMGMLGLGFLRAGVKKK